MVGKASHIIVSRQLVAPTGDIQCWNDCTSMAHFNSICISNIEIPS